MMVSNSLNVMGPTVDMIWMGKLGPDDIAALQKGFPCLEDLEAATSAQIAMKTGLDEQVAGVLVGAFACIAKQSAG